MKEITLSTGQEVEVEKWAASNTVSLSMSLPNEFKQNITIPQKYPDSSKESEWLLKATSASTGIDVDDLLKLIKNDLIYLTAAVLYYNEESDRELPPRDVVLKQVGSTMFVDSDSMVVVGNE